MQRIWLTAESLGLKMQPAFAPLIFAHCGRQGEAFTESRVGRAKAEELANRLQQLLGDVPADDVVLYGRIGTPRGQAETARAIRKPLTELIGSEGRAHG